MSTVPCRATTLPLSTHPTLFTVPNLRDLPRDHSLTRPVQQSRAAGRRGSTSTTTTRLRTAKGSVCNAQSNSRQRPADMCVCVCAGAQGSQISGLGSRSLLFVFLSYCGLNAGWRWTCICSVLLLLKLGACVLSSQGSACVLSSQGSGYSGPYPQYSESTPNPPYPTSQPLPSGSQADSWTHPGGFGSSQQPWQPQPGQASPQSQYVRPAHPPAWPGTGSGAPPPYQPKVCLLRGQQRSGPD